MRRFHLKGMSDPRPTKPFEGLSTSELPQWLKSIMTDERHRASVLEELEDREAIRTQHRYRFRPSYTLQGYGPSVPSGSAAEQHQNDTLEKFYSISLATDPRHRPLNRYSDIAAYDRGCVMVARNDAVGSQQYLNGNWVREVGGKAWWLATQVRKLRGMLYVNRDSERGRRLRYQGRCTHSSPCVHLLCRLVGEFAQ
jgi:hypothetical protein